MIVLLSGVAIPLPANCCRKRCIIPGSHHIVHYDQTQHDGIHSEMIQPHHCPVCRKAVSAGAQSGLSSFPFCSDRCKKVDMLRWCDGRYAIVEEIDPQIAQFLSDNPDMTDPDEGSAADATAT